MISRLTRTVSLLNKKEKRAYSILTMSLFTISLLAIFIVRPSIKIVAQYQKNLAQAKAADAALTEKIVNLDKAKVNIEEQKDNITKLYRQLPKDMMQEALLTNLARTATAYNISIVKMGIDQSHEMGKKGLNSVNITLDVAGTYDSITGLVSSLENSERFIKFTSISVENKDGKNTGTMNITVFYLN